MTVTQDLDIWTLIVHASFVVKVVMFLLAAVSFMSWMFIFQKWFSIRRAASQTDKFEREFWSGNDLNALYQGAVHPPPHHRQPGAHLRGRVPRVRQAEERRPAPRRRERHGRRRAPRDAR